MQSNLKDIFPYIWPVMWIVANIIYCLVKVYTLNKKKKQTFLKHYIKVTARVALEWLFCCEKVIVLTDFSPNATQSQRITYLNEICDNMEILHSSQSENDEDENAPKSNNLSTFT